ncbi:hypothetical protein [Kitasatospora sp. NPDC101183]|uniref:hypothetical protein n=1 Tax=Kitasatospora sp. NPDC101183 TaxID=3364100 RepID=UPI0038294D6E
MSGTKTRLGALLGALCLAAIATTAAAAAAPAAAARPGPAALDGAGWEINPALDTAIYSGPGLSTPRIGTAWQNDNVAGVCRKQDNNQAWLVLGIERPGRNGVQWANTAGWIWAADFSQNTSFLPLCDDYQPRYSPTVDTSLYSGPGLSTPQIGTAWAGDEVIALCVIYDNNSKPLLLGIERPGRNGVQWANTAGYIWGADIRTDNVQNCGSV